MQYSPLICICFAPHLLLHDNFLTKNTCYEGFSFHVIFFALLLGNALQAQVTLYSENFSNGLNDNKGQNETTYDMSGVSNWTVDVSNGTFSSGKWFKQTTAGYFESKETEAASASPVAWFSPVTDITCYTNVTVSVDLGRYYSNSSSGCRAQYSLDGGTWTTFGTVSGSTGAPDNGFTNYSVNGLSGSTIQIRVLHWGTSSTPYYRHDNVLIQGTDDYPSVQASALLLTNYTGTSIDLSWTNGNGDRVIVLAKENSGILTDPVKGVSYTANTVYGSGNEIGIGNFVVYEGTGTSVTITGLINGVDYDFVVYAYFSSGPCYNPNELFGSTMCTHPTTSPSGTSTAGVTANSLNLSWTNGNGDRTLVVARQNGTAIAEPSSGTSYTANAAFGYGDEIGVNNFVVYEGTGTGVTVSSLISNTTCDFSIYTYNSADDCYNLTEATASTTTLTVFAPYEIDVVNGLIISTCSGHFYDSGGSGGGYANNENYSVTFCSASGLPLKFDFSSSGNLDLNGANGDTLFFYDGMTATGTPIAILTSADDVAFTQLMINTFSTCVTIVWKSDGSVTDGGWDAVITCGAAPSCLSNIPAADIFGQATTICNIDDYCGTTASYYGEDGPFNFFGGGNCPTPDDGLFAGTIENNSWLKFQALSTTATFNFNVPTGGGCVSGIQVGVYAFNESTHLFSLKSPCALTDGSHSGSFTVTASSLTPGEMYYVMIDGNAGDQCDYTLGVSTGVAIINAGPDQSVCGSSATLNATSTLNTGTWSVLSGTGTFADANNPNTTVSGLTLGSNVFLWAATSDLCGDVLDSVTVVSNSCLPVTMLDLDAEYVADLTVRVNWATASEINNDYFTVERSANGFDFSPVAVVDGQGNSNMVYHYSVPDNVPERKTWYYRIRQTDFDGTMSISQVVSADPGNDGENDALIISNGENNDLIVYFTANEDMQFDLMLYDIAGRLLYLQSVEAIDGPNAWEIPAEVLPVGMSMIMLQNSTRVYWKKHIR